MPYSINNTPIINRVGKQLIKSEDITKYLDGTSIKIDALTSKTFLVIDYCKIQSKKDNCDYYYTFQFLLRKNAEGKSESSAVCYFTHTGSKDIKTFFDKVDKGEIKLPIAVTLLKEGNTMYFNGYRDYNEVVANDIMAKYGIKAEDLSILDTDI